jgi:hypothetical protein
LEKNSSAAQNICVRPVDVGALFDLMWIVGSVVTAGSSASPGKTICLTDVIPDPHCDDWYWVLSRTRPGLWHLVDVAYQDEPWITPYAACSCEAYQIGLTTMGRPCWHIKTVRKWRKLVAQSIQETTQRTATAGQAGAPET